VDMEELKPKVRHHFNALFESNTSAK